VDADSGGTVDSKVRTSSGAFLKRQMVSVIAGIESRIAAWTLINDTQGEGIQILRYEYGQKYDEHYDYFFHDAANQNGGNRMATVLMYLSEVEEGGETVFPKAELSPYQEAHPSEFSECGMRGLAVKPKKGDALLFFSLTTTGELDVTSIHGGCPVLQGTKWSATKWIHVAPMDTAGEVQHVVFTPPPPPLPRGCIDKHKQCKSWAMQGECNANSAYMLGKPEEGVEGGCLASCGACHLMLSNTQHEPHIEI